MKRIIFICLSCILCLSLLVGCGEKTNINGSLEEATRILDEFDRMEQEEQKKKEEEANRLKEFQKNIEVEDMMTEKGQLVLKINNKNDDTVNLDIEVELYDANDAIVDTKTDMLFGIAAKTEVYLPVTNSYSKEFDHYKYYVDVSNYTYKAFMDKVSITSNDNDDQIVVQATNDSEEDIDSIEVTVLFYNGDKLVYAGTGMDYNIKAGRSANMKVSYYNLKESYRDTEKHFDRYEVHLFEAYSYDF